MQILPDRVSEWKCFLVHSDKPDDTSLYHDAIIAPYDKKSNLVRQTDTNYVTYPYSSWIVPHRESHAQTRFYHLLGLTDLLAVYLVPILQKGRTSGHFYYHDHHDIRELVWCI